MAQGIVVVVGLGSRLVAKSLLSCRTECRRSCSHQAIWGLRVGHDRFRAGVQSSRDSFFDLGPETVSSSHLTFFKSEMISGEPRCLIF